MRSLPLASGLAHAVDGSLLVALPVAFVVGLLSFLSPCTLPLVPGYLSYVTGLSGSALEARDRSATRRLLAGSALFVLGFSAVFVTAGALFGSLGGAVREHARGLEQVLGVATVVLGLGFLGAVPLLQREWRLRRRPAPGLLGAPLLGVAFGLGWAPCQGPTLGAIQALALTSASAAQGALLTLAYCLGLGLPFVAVALGLRRVLAGVGVARRHAHAITVAGGVMLVAIGLLLVTGTWDHVTVWLRTHVGTGVGVTL